MQGNVTFIPVNHDPWADLPKGPTELRQGPMEVKDWLPFVGEALKQYAGEKLKSTFSALALPGNVLQGKVDPTSEEGFSATMALAGLLPQVGMPLAKEGAVGLFGGKLSHSADLKNLAAAQAAEELGLPKRTIWEDTGWFRGADKDWRYETPDTRSHFRAKHDLLLNNAHIPLGQIFSHPEMFDAYPHLTKTSYFQADRGSRLGGSFNPNINEIFVNSAQSLPAMRSVLLHELQHAIQHREGFQRGGMADEFRNLHKFFPQVTQMSKLAAALEHKRNPYYLENSLWKKNDIADIMRLAEHPEKHLNDLLLRFQKIIPQSPYDVYSRLAGEVEARAVQKRFDMAKMHGEGYYKSVPPWEDYDVPSALQLLRKDTPFGTTLRFAGD